MLASIPPNNINLRPSKLNIQGCWARQTTVEDTLEHSPILVESWEDLCIPDLDTEFQSPPPGDATTREPPVVALECEKAVSPGTNTNRGACSFSHSCGVSSCEQVNGSCEGNSAPPDNTRPDNNTVTYTPNRHRQQTITAVQDTSIATMGNQLPKNAEVDGNHDPPLADSCHGNGSAKGASGQPKNPPDGNAKSKTGKKIRNALKIGKSKRRRRKNSRNSFHGEGNNWKYQGTPMVPGEERDKENAIHHEERNVDAGRNSVTDEIALFQTNPQSTDDDHVENQTPTTLGNGGDSYQDASDLKKENTLKPSPVPADDMETDRNSKENLEEDFLSAVLSSVDQKLSGSEFSLSAKTDTAKDKTTTTETPRVTENEATEGDSTSSSRRSSGDILSTPKRGKLSLALKISETISKLDFSQCEPEICVGLLRIPSMQTYAALNKKLQTSDKEWIQGFLDNDGLEVLLNCVETRGKRRVTLLSDAMVLLECVACVKSVMNNQMGLEYIIQNPEYTRKLVKGEDLFIITLIVYHNIQSMLGGAVSDDNIITAGQCKNTLFTYVKTRQYIIWNVKNV